MKTKKIEIKIITLGYDEARQTYTASEDDAGEIATGKTIPALKRGIKRWQKRAKQ